MSRIMALCMRPCAAEASAGDPSGLLEEVTVDYLRTMNKIVLEAQIKEVHFAFKDAPIYRAFSRTEQVGGSGCASIGGTSTH